MAPVEMPCSPVTERRIRAARAWATTLQKILIVLMGVRLGMDDLRKRCVGGLCGLGRTTLYGLNNEMFNLVTWRAPFKLGKLPNFFPHFLGERYLEPHKKYPCILVCATNYGGCCGCGLGN